MKTIIHSQKAPQAIGPYSQAVKFNNLIFTSGMIPMNPTNGLLVEGDAAAQTRQVLENIKVLLEESGSSLDRVLKTTIFIKNMNDFSSVNQVYAEYFIHEQPARSTVEVARLPKDVLVEIETIAAI